MSDSLKPQWFVLRENGSFVPLIAYDELPHHVRIAGVNRTLEANECIGMTCVGATPSRHKFHQIENLSGGYREPNAREIKLIPTIVSSIPDREPERSYGVAEQPPSSFAGSLVSRHVSEVEPLPQWHESTMLANRPAPKGRKVYCSHWMSTGECDFAQQGCIYKHEMPYDPEKLKELGFQDLPKWYRELHGLGKFRAVPGSGAHIFGSRPAEMPRPWRASEGPSNLYMGRGRRAARREPSNIERVHRRRAIFHNLLDVDDGTTESGDTISNNDLLKSRYAVGTPSLMPQPLAATSSNHTASSSLVATVGHKTSRGRRRVVDKAAVYRRSSPTAMPSRVQRGRSHTTSEAATSDVDVEAMLHRHELARKVREEAEYAAQVAQRQAQKVRDISESQPQEAHEQSLRGMLRREGPVRAQAEQQTPTVAVPTQTLRETAVIGDDEQGSVARREPMRPLLQHGSAQESNLYDHDHDHDTR